MLVTRGEPARREVLRVLLDKLSPFGFRKASSFGGCAFDPDLSRQESSASVSRQLSLPTLRRAF
jgi:hypothetical protein